MITNRLEIIGRLEKLQEPTAFFLGDSEGEQEVSGIELNIGTAFYALMHDPLFSEGKTCKVIGYLAATPLVEQPDLILPTDLCICGLMLLSDD